MRYEFPTRRVMPAPFPRDSWFTLVFMWEDRVASSIDVHISAGQVRNFVRHLPYPPFDPTYESLVGLLECRAYVRNRRPLEAGSRWDDIWTEVNETRSVQALDPIWVTTPGDPTTWGDIKHEYP